jgi:ABC-2 type transport system ATP-binding protein
MSAHAIDVDRLRFSYPGGVTALDDLSFSVAPGIVFGFLGPNGAGKTTTLHVLLGMLRREAGRVSVLGVDPSLDGGDVRRRSGALLEHTGLYEQLTAEENLRFYGRAYGLSDDECEGRVEALLTELELRARGRERVGTWSKGMKQRLAIARAMVARPELLFLDEPTSGLDVAGSVDVRRAIAALAHGAGVTVFLTTHNMSEAEALCDDVAIVRSGRVVFQGSPAEARIAAASPDLESAFLKLQEDSHVR